MDAHADALTLSGRDLAFFRLTCDLFPSAESPLRYLEDEPWDVNDADTIFADLQQRGLVNSSGSGASQEVLDRLMPVSECDARVVLRQGTAGDTVRNFYVSGDATIEYSQEGDAHCFGPRRSEAALAAELAQHFKTGGASPRQLHLSAGDYLVFAVFARDARSTPEPEAADNDSMSIEEVLAYFDEPEANHARTPNDDSWNDSVQSLAGQGVLVQQDAGWSLHPSLHPLAREIVADHQHTIMRFDFLDEQWLVREVSLYPTSDSVYRVGTETDGSVSIQELSTTALADVLAGVVSTLPNLLNPDVPPMLRSGYERPR